jgi:hypothetical protein
MATGEVRLNRGRLLFGVATLVFIVRQLLILAFVLRLPIRPGHRFVLFLFARWGSPRSLLYAMMAGAVATALAELIVMTLVRPLERTWLSPRVDGSAGLFQLSAREWVVAESPARRHLGWIWRAGTLIRSNLRVWFVAEGWNVTAWSVPIDGTTRARLVASPSMGWGLVDGMPDLLQVKTEGSEIEVFAVQDPTAVFSWFRPHSATPAPGAVVP